jgi:hypothetical protein
VCVQKGSRVGRYAIELLLALLAIVIITILYAIGTWNGIPGPGSLAGHGLGIVGFLLMLATETLYTLRKRLRGFHYGPTGIWLRVHVFTGIVGPYLVLLHTAGKLNGLAGVLTFVTVVVVLSGFVGRYIYTATPRTIEGVEVGVQELQRQIAETDAQLQAVGGHLGEAARAILDSETAGTGWVIVLARPYLRWRERRRVHAALEGLKGEDRARVESLERLLDDHYRLLLQAHSLVATRRLLALWHLFHVPMGGVLFTLAFIHVFAAVYYSTLLK